MNFIPFFVNAIVLRYGEEAALIAKDATDAYKNMNVVRRNFKGNKKKILFNKEKILFCKKY